MAKKLAYYERIYNTVAIEGSTLSLREVIEILIGENVVIRGKTPNEHAEVLGMRDAIKYVEANPISCNQITLEVN